MKEFKSQRQTAFFKIIKDLIPASTTMVSELADLLEISSDSMYRRIRGETSLTFDEVITLCRHFKISFDSFINIESGNVTFNYTLMEHGQVSFKKYLTSMRDDLKIIKAAKNHKITYACEDIPIFHSINYIDLAAFKMMYWMKAILNIPELEGVKFTSNVVSEDLKKLGNEIYELYASVPSVEIWTETTITGTLKQIEFFWEAGMFESKDDALNVIDALRKTIETIQKQAEQGTKVLHRNKSEDEFNNYSIYHSEIELANNCVLVDLGEVRAVYLGHQTFNTMNTSNATYCGQTEQWLNNIIRKATLISQVGEKNRYQFFQAMFSRMDKMAERISEG